MKCPKCGTEMELGFVQSAKEIFYTEHPRKWFFLVSPRLAPKGEDIKLTTNSVSPATCDAWHCPKCRTVTIEY